MDVRSRDSSSSSHSASLTASRATIRSAICDVGLYRAVPSRSPRESATGISAGASLSLAAAPASSDSTSEAYTHKCPFRSRSAARRVIRAPNAPSPVEARAEDAGKSFFSAFLSPPLSRPASRSCARRPFWRSPVASRWAGLSREVPNLPPLTPATLDGDKEGAAGRRALGAFGFVAEWSLRGVVMDTSSGSTIDLPFQPSCEVAFS
jgi:hypothetical protein